MLNLAPPLVEHEEVQEAPKPEKKEGSDVMEASRVLPKQMVPINIMFPI